MGEGSLGQSFAHRSMGLSMPAVFISADGQFDRSLCAGNARNITQMRNGDRILFDGWRRDIFSRPIILPPRPDWFPPIWRLSTRRAWQRRSLWDFWRDIFHSPAPRSNIHPCKEHPSAWSAIFADFALCEQHAADGLRIRHGIDFSFIQRQSEFARGKNHASDFLPRDRSHWRPARDWRK